MTAEHQQGATSFPAGGRLRRAGLALLDELEALAGATAREVVDAARHRLGDPVRVVVAGRVSSGKSTLVNALVGMHVAPTAARELTAVLTVFGFGAPPRAEIHLEGGATRQTAMGDDGPELGDLAPEEVAHIQVRMPQGPLRQITLVDTPGLGSATTEHARRAASRLVAGALRGRPPEVVLYVVRDEYRDADHELLTVMLDDWAAEGAPPPRPVVVLSHADNFGAGAWDSRDPIELARSGAATIGERYELDAVAVSGLLAETARTGRWRESHLRALRRLSPASDEDLSLDLVLGTSNLIETGELTQLHTLLGGYGLRHGRAHAASSVELRAWLEEVSGIDAVERVLAAHAVPGIECERVDALLAELARTARREGWPGEAEAALERARSAPGLHVLREWRAASELRRVRPGSALLAELEMVLDRSSAVPTSADECRRRSAYHQSQVATAGTGAEAQAASVLTRSYLLLAKQAEGDDA